MLDDSVKSNGRLRYLERVCVDSGDVLGVVFFIDLYPKSDFERPQSHGYSYFATRCLLESKGKGPMGLNNDELFFEYSRRHGLNEDLSLIEYVPLDVVIYQSYTSF